MSKKVLVIGDSPSTPTGFSQVIYNIFKHFDPNEYDIHQLGINYYGDPHEIPWKIYPASLRGDIWGIGRLQEFAEKGFDCIFILNDIWVQDKILETLKQVYPEKKVPSVISYFPVDSYEFDSEWFKHFDIVTQTVVYTEFGRQVVLDAKPDLIPFVVPHGVDKETFFKVNVDKEELKRTMFPNKPEFFDSFIILNANRNQPRKRVDLTMEGFKLFAENKPENVKLYLHMGLKDAGFNVVALAGRLGIDRRLIITNKSPNIQTVPVKRLNMIYNATDVGINTSLGEGWGLCSVEHTMTGAPQIVPAHSACKELYEDCGELVPISQWLHNQETLTVSGIVKPEDIAKSLESVYSNPDIYQKFSKDALDKFSRPEYDWKNISKRFQNIFESC